MNFGPLSNYRIQTKANDLFIVKSAIINEKIHSEARMLNFEAENCLCLPLDRRQKLQKLLYVLMSSKHSHHSTHANRQDLNLNEMIETNNRIRS